MCFPRTFCGSVTMCYLSQLLSSPCRMKAFSLTIHNEIMLLTSIPELTGIEDSLIQGP